MSVMVDRPTKKHGITLSMRTPTAKVIEEFVVDFAYGTAAGRTVGTKAPTVVEKDLAKAIDLGMKVGKTRTQLLLPDQKDLLEEFKRQLRVICQGMHVWQGGPLGRNYVKALERVVADVERFQALSLVDKMVNALGAKN